MKRTMIIGFGLAILILGAAVASGSTQTEFTPPTPELTRQLDAFESKLMTHETAISECMAEAGFEYAPSLPADWIMERAVALDVAAGGNGMVNVDTPADPNRALVAQLSPDQATAYQAAYWGNETAPGCYHTTYEAVFGVNPTEELQRLALVADQVDAALAQNPAMTKALADYRACMQVAGFQVQGFWEVFDQLDERRQVVESAARASGDAISEAPGYSEYASFEDSALSAHDACALDYHAVEDQLRSELVSRYLNER